MCDRIYIRAGWLCMSVWLWSNYINELELRVLLHLVKILGKCLTDNSVT